MDSTMRAARFHRYGPPEVLQIDRLPLPAPGPEDLLVRVHAAAVNPVDAKIRQGIQRRVVTKRLPTTTGLDLAGEVVQVGAAVERFSPGDRVFASPTHRREGTCADYALVGEAEAGHAPRTLDMVEAAALPLVSLTVYQALVEFADLREGEHLFVQAGAGGTGSIALQLGRHLGAQVATTCSGRNTSFAADLGAHQVIDYEKEAYDEVLADVDVALESLGGPHLARTRSILRRGGRLPFIQTGLPAAVRRLGPTLGTLWAGGGIAAFTLASRLRGIRARPIVRRPDGLQLDLIARLADGGALRPHVSRVYPLEEIVAAHQAIETGRTRGKIVVQLA